MQKHPGTPESRDTKHRQAQRVHHDPQTPAKAAPKPFAKNEGDRHVVNGIGDTGDEEKERHTVEERNRVSRTRE